MKEGKTKSIDELVNQVLRSMGLERKFKEHEVCQVWPEIVGNMISSKTTKLDFVDGVLFVSFNSAVVKNEMSMVKEGVIMALNKKVGMEIVKEMVIR